MNIYDAIIEWLCAHWLTSILLLGAVVLMSIPQVRDGVVLLWSWGKKLFPKCRATDIPFVFKHDEETVTFTELLRSIQHDVVIVHAHTHILGVAAEYAWIRHYYPKSETVQQVLTSMKLASNRKASGSEDKSFDIITIKRPDGSQKEIFFDISEFFGGSSSQYLDPDKYISGKIKGIYKSRAFEQSVAGYDPQVVAMHTQPLAARLPSTARGSSPEP